MLEQLEVRVGHRVLEIGAATGYNAALLSHLSGEAGTVITVDLDPVLTATAVENLRRAGVHGVKVVTGDGWAGVPLNAPFDRIVATVGVWDLSPAWIDQLRPGGVLEVPLWLRAGLQASVAFEKTDDGLRSRSIEPCAFMRLQGLGAGPESYTRLGRWTAHLDHPQPTDVAILSQLLEQPARTQDPPALDAGWFTAIALSAPGAVMLANWEERVTLSGMFDPADGSLAVIESDCRGPEPLPRALHTYGAGGALSRLTRLMEETHPIGLDEVRIDAVQPDTVVDDERLLGRLSRPYSQFLISGINRP